MMTQVRSVYPKVVPELLVTNFNASRRFYVGLLGFAVLYDRPEKKFAYLDLDGAQIMIEETDEPWLTGAMEKPYGRGIKRPGIVVAFPGHAVGEIVLA